MLGFLGKMILGGALEKVTGVAKTFFGDKQERDKQQADAQTAIYGQYANEFTKPTNWFDSFITGLNRLPRPLGFFLTVWLFVWPLYDLNSFVDAMNAYTLFPEWLGLLISAVWGFYFAGRLLSKDLNFGQGISKKKVKEYVENRQALQVPQGAAPAPTAYSVVPVSTDPYREAEAIADDEYKKEMNSLKPLSLDAIVEWNRRKQQQ
jgi:hypothetical protein